MKGYTAKVGLRKAKRLRKIDWLNKAIRESTDPVMRSAWQCELYLLTGPYWHRGGFKGVAYDNTGLSEEQREINRLKWLLIEGCARADIATTTGSVLAMAKHVRDIMQENQMLLVWMSDYEKRLNEP